MRSGLGVVLLSLCLTGSSGGSLACAYCKTRGQTPVVFVDGIVNEARTIYQSTEVDAEMLHFPQGRKYDLVHDLREAPYDVSIFVSFRDTLEPPGSGEEDEKTKPNNIAPSSGNLAVIEVQDENIIRVRNDTCSDMYLRIVAYADPNAASDGSETGEAGAAGAASF